MTPMRPTCHSLPFPLLSSVLGSRQMASQMSLLWAVFALFAEAAVAEDPGWISLCSAQGTKEVTATACPSGISATKPFPVTSACVNGIWILSTGPCDLSPKILVGRGHSDCFAIDAQVGRVTFVGKAGEPFAASDFAGPSSLAVFFLLSRGKASAETTGPSRDFALLSINSHNAPSCCPSEGKTASPVHLCLGTSQSGASFRAQHTCPSPTPPTLASFPLTYGVGLQLRGGHLNESTFLYADAGRRACGREKASLQTESSAALACDDDDDAQAALEQKRINEQTGRVATKYLHWTLWRKKEKRVEHRDFIYVDIGRRILSSVCHELSKHILDATLHIFRLLLTETMEKSPFVKHFEEKRHERILQALMSCERGKGKTSMEIEWSPNHTCPPKVRSILVSNESGKQAHAMDFSSNETFRYDALDFSLEVAWKIMSFTHYFCAKDFRTHPLDHSQLMVSMEAFFNQELLRRWANPGKAYHVLQLLFTTFNLPKFATTLDACVAGAKATSDYQQWIHRPFLPKLGPSGGRPSANWIWDNSTLCLNSFWDDAVRKGTNPTAACLPSYSAFYQT